MKKMLLLEHRLNWFSGLLIKCANCRLASTVVLVKRCEKSRIMPIKTIQNNIWNSVQQAPKAPLITSKWCLYPNICNLVWNLSSRYLANRRTIQSSKRHIATTLFRENKQQIHQIICNFVWTGRKLFALPIQAYETLGMLRWKLDEK